MAEHGLAMLMAAVTLLGILAGYRVALVLARGGSSIHFGDRYTAVVLQIATEPSLRQRTF